MANRFIMLSMTMRLCHKVYIHQQVCLKKKMSCPVVAKRPTNPLALRAHSITLASPHIRAIHAGYSGGLVRQWLPPS